LPASEGYLLAGSYVETNPLYDQSAAAGRNRVKMYVTGKILIRLARDQYLKQTKRA